MLNFSMKLTIFAALAALLPALTVGKSLLGEDLPEGCEKFTVGKCDPSKVSRNFL